MNERTKNIVHRLIGFVDAYPEDIFPPITERVRKENATLITQASGCMGRHMGKFMKEAADELEALSERLERALDLLEEIEERIEITSFKDNGGWASVHHKICEFRGKQT